MANIKRNNIAGRCIVAAGTLLAGLGIWSSVAQSPLPTAGSEPPAIVMSAPTIDPSLSDGDISLNRPGIQTGQITPQPPSPSQPFTVQSAPAPAQPVPVQPVPTPAKAVPAQPAPTVVPTPAKPKPVTTPKPRLRTRGS